MKILITGANGYIGSRLAPCLAEEGHELIALVREPQRLHWEDPTLERTTIVQGDLLDLPSMGSLPKDIDAAYYLVHSMRTSHHDFPRLDEMAAKNFVRLLDNTSCQQILYLGGIQDVSASSRHLQSRREIESILEKAKAPLTVLRAAIIVGSGSASFEIIRALVEKLPVMIAPKWIKSLCQPIAISDVLYYLKGALCHPCCFGKTFDIGGPDILSYEKMLLDMAEVRGLARKILPVPVLTPRLSSYWLYLVTPTNYYLARSLVDGLKNDVICHNSHIRDILPRKCLPYKVALEKAFDKIAQGGVSSSWTDAISSGRTSPKFFAHIHPPKEGCVEMSFTKKCTISPKQVYACFTDIGGKRGWYYMNWAWSLRGMIDKLLGGVGLRRGRVSRRQLRIGDALDFWRVLLIDDKQYRLLLYAEMKLPGEAWLEFAIEEKNGERYLRQSAIFRPLGILGRCYWYALFLPHYFLLKGLLRTILEKAAEE